MNFDAFSTAAIAAELRTVILSGRVQRVVQINSLTYGFEIFIHPTRYNLIISVEPQAPRLHLTAEKVRRGSGNETPLMLVLRKYMRGARLIRIEQPPYERILQFDFHTTFGPITLVSELLGTRSNLILLNAEQTILGVARLSKPADDAPHRRILIPNQPYQPPPVQDKLTPPDLTEATLRRELQEASPTLPLTRLLPGIVRGISPLLAREITFRATGNINTAVAQLNQPDQFLELFHQIFTHLQNDDWQAALAYDEAGEPLAFAPYPLNHLPHSRPADSFSAAVETFFAETAAGYTAAKSPVSAVIAEVRQRLARRRKRLQEDADALADPIGQKEKGEAVLAYAHQIKPGQTELIVQWFADGPLLKIKLDPALSASENAHQYFQRYRKGQRADGEIPTQLKKVVLEEQFLEQLEQDLAMAEDRPEIDAIAGALTEAGYYRTKRGRANRPKQTAGRYLRLCAPDGATVWVGKNAVQNAHLTFSRASTDDLWLHARGVPGAHVIVPTAQGLPSEADVFWAAGIAAHYSRGRGDTTVEVDVTVKKYVRAIKGAAPGLVTYRNETTLNVRPQTPDPESEM
jgi:predicted ribosome quality control (RQC) complex YloA/Tae2 family protein